MDLGFGGWNSCILAMAIVTAIASAGLVVMCAAGGICRQWERISKRKQAKEARIGRLNRLRGRLTSADDKRRQGPRWQRWNRRPSKLNNRRLSAI